MKNKQKKNTGVSRYAVTGIGLSILSLFGLAGVLVMKALEFAGMYTPTDLTLLTRLLWGSIAGFVIGLAVFALLDPHRVRRFISGRQAKYGSNALLISFAFFVIVIVANLLAFQNPKEWDWTEDKQNTLAPETINVLNSLPEPVTATAFFSNNYPKDSARELLDKFKNNSNGRFDYEFVDPDTNPIRAQEAGITGDGKILLQMGEHREIIATASEDEITGGFIRLLNPEEVTVYFLSGEGEHDTQETGDTSYTRIRQALESKNYVVNVLNLEAQKIPEDAKVIVAAGPTAPLSKQAMEALSGYLASGGSLVALEDSTAISGLDAQGDNLAKYLSSQWGITLNDDIVIDTQSPTSAYNATAYSYSQHPITEKMGGITVAFPFARSLAISTEIPDITVTDLIYTTDAAWGETDFSSIETNQPAYDPQSEKIGPMLLAAAAENFTTKGRVVVIGNSLFATDANFDYNGNGDLLVNIVDWGAEKEELISLTTGEPIQRSFAAPSPFRRNFMLVGTLCLIPLIIIGLGVAAWVGRRRQG